MNKIFYGIKGNYTDITSNAIQKCINNNRLIIPQNDHDRAILFGDPIPSTLKHIMINIRNLEHVFCADQKIDLPVTKIVPDKQEIEVEMNDFTIVDNAIITPFIF